MSMFNLHRLRLTQSKMTTTSDRITTSALHVAAGRSHIETRVRPKRVVTPLWT
jgi:hypothetical protein